MSALLASLETTLVAGMPGGWELMVILLIILLLFGRKIPGVARSLGQGISSFKKGLNEPLEEDRDDKPARRKDLAAGDEGTPD
jgi:sec-independent protein translocase protein TatA